jgi:hypothetical protein
MPTAEATAFRLDATLQLKRLRRQVLFLFAFAVITSMILSFALVLNSNRIEYARYDACLARQADIFNYNVQLQPLGIPLYPVPNCGRDPRAD